MKACTTEAMINLSATCTKYEKLIENKRLWKDINTELEYPGEEFMAFLINNASHVLRLKCKFKHEDLDSAKLNEILPLMSNLISLNLASCKVFYSAHVFQYLPNLVYLNVSDCHLGLYKVIDRWPKVSA